jgi:hypothetical protein
MTPEEEARVFFDKVYSWSNDGAWRSVWTAKVMQAGDKPIFYGTDGDDLDTLMKGWRFYTKSNQDVYVCMSTQTKTLGVPEGKKMRKATKHAVDAGTLKSLWLDVDVKPKGYADFRAAMDGIVTFIKAINLPRPTLVVNTGGGLHFHWIVDTPMTPAEWLPLAEALKTACIQHGLPIDTSVIADAARLMRVPGTQNFKYGSPRPVKLVGKVVPEMPLALMRAALMPFVGVAAAHTPHLSSAAPSSVFSAPQGQVSSVFAGTVAEDLSAGISEARSTPVDMEAVCQQCPLYAALLENGGADADNPVWNQSVLGTTFAPEGTGLDWAHKISSGHAGYSLLTTDALYQRKVTERERGDIGFPSCATFARLSPYSTGICSSCKWPSEGITSPLKLGANDFDLPKGYFRRNGHVWTKVPTKDGETDDMQITSLGVRDAHLEADPRTGISLHMTLVPPKGPSVPITLPGKAMSAVADVAAVFGACGMPPHEYTKRHLKEFTVSYTAHLQGMKGAVRHAHAYGWAMKDGVRRGFAYNGRLYTPTSDNEPTRRADRTIVDYYTPNGSLKPWKDAADFITSQQRPALAAILAASFGAPLVHFTGQSGVVLSAQSNKSGVGKTSTIRVGAAVWGHPKSSMMQLDDTSNNAMYRAGTVRNLPLFWDEVKGADQTAKFTAIAFQISQGREKARMTAEMNVREMGQWETMLLVGSNERISAKVADNTDTSAGVMRVLEWEVPEASSATTTTQASQIINQTDHHYGHAGIIYAKWLGENSLAASLMVERAMTYFESKAGATQDERFWIAGAAAMYCGAMIAKKLGLVAFDLPALQTFLLDTITANRGTKITAVADLDGAENVWNLLQYFLNDRQGHVLHTDIFTAGGTAKATVRTDIDHSMVKVVQVHVAHKPGKIRIDHAAFADWCRRSKKTTSTIEAAMKKHFGMTTIKTVLGGGTSYSRGMQCKAIEIDVAGWL